MQRILLIILILTCGTATAEVFKRIGPDGQVYFSDQPSPGAERVKVAPVQTMSLPPVPETTDTAGLADSGSIGEQHEAPADYSEFSITSPTSEEGVRANNGNITVHLSLQPSLLSGHRITLHISGEDGEADYPVSGMSVELSNLSRGLHTVSAAVVDKRGEVIARTTPVSFYVLRVALGGG
jgi:hypothetical protein